MNALQPLDNNNGNGGLGNPLPNGGNDEGNDPEINEQDRNDILNDMFQTKEFALQFAAAGNAPMPFEHALALCCVARMGGRRYTRPRRALRFVANFRNGVGWMHFLGALMMEDGFRARITAEVNRLNGNPDAGQRALPWEEAVLMALMIEFTGPARRNGFVQRMLGGGIRQEFVLLLANVYLWVERNGWVPTVAVPNLLANDGGDTEDESGDENDGNANGGDGNANAAPQA